MRFHIHLSLALLLLVVVCGLTAAIDSVLLGRSFLRQGMPILDEPYFWLRRGISGICGLAFAYAVIRGRDSRSVLATGAWGSSSGAAPAAVAVVAAAVLGVLQAINPALFSAFAREDAGAETLSAFLLLAGALTLLGAAVVLARQPRGRRAGVVPAVLLGMLLFVIGMEELSWLQRILDVQTPDWVADINGQGETNFHNMATYASEISYYLGGFALLALFPLLADASPPSPASRRYPAFVPGRFVLIAGVMTTLFSAKIWDVIPAQLAYFGSIGALLGYAVLLKRAGRRGEAALFAAGAAVLAVVGPLTLLTHEAMVRAWDDTENKELLIAFALAFYAVQTSGRLIRGVSISEQSSPEILSDGNIRASSARPVS